MNQKPKYYVTTAIAYASKKPHFGNTYEAIMTDAIARYKREMGYDVYFCTGTDEHGQKIEDLAVAAGITPKAYVDNVAGEIKSLWDKMNVSYDYFVRTTDDYHEAAVQKMFKKFHDQGDIYRAATRAGTACPASPSSPTPRPPTASAPTAAARCREPPRRPISST